MENATQPTEVDAATVSLSLRDVAVDLRLTPDVVTLLVERKSLLGELIDGQWRFTRAALDEFKRNRGRKETLLRQAGAFADDPMLPEILLRIYRDRGRPEDGRM